MREAAADSHGRRFSAASPSRSIGSAKQMTTAKQINSRQGIPAASTRERRWFWAILAAALFMRLLVVSFEFQKPVMQFYSHPWEMGLLANSLIHGLGYSSPFGVPTGPTAFIAPGYPTIVAGIFLLFGAYTSKSALVIVLLNVAAALGTIALIMRLARRLFGIAAAYIAGTVWAVSLPVLWLPVIFWESNLSALFFVTMLTLALRTRGAPTGANWILLGAFTGVAALINPALIFSFVAIMGWVAVEAWLAARANSSNTSSAIRWKPPVLGVLALTAVFIAWPIRNAVRFHAFIPLRSTVGFEMWMGNRAGATGRLDESIYPMLNQHELDLYKAQGEVAYIHGKSAAAWSYIGSHPAWFTAMTTRRIFRFWSGTGNVDGSPLYEAHALATTLLGLLGLGLLYRRNRSLAVLFALPLLLFPLPYYMTHAEFRYRLNLDPVLTLLAGYAAMRVVAAVRTRRSRPTLHAAIPQPSRPSSECLGTGRSKPNAVNPSAPRVSRVNN